jgi:heme/copper-type cytochrome/quinol oxidase subunit 2
LPVYNHVRVIVTSTDVLHSWAIPSAGVKMDACPGRLNQLDLFLSRRGIFYGQCSELCGINHGFMPIVIQGVRFSKFVNWLCEEATASEMKKRLTKGTELLHAHIKAGKASFSMYATPSKEWIWSWNATKFRW